MTDSFTIQWTPACGTMRKLVFEPQSDGEYAWARIEYELSHSQWREVGFEYLEEVSFVGDHKERSTPPQLQADRTGGDADE